MIQSDHLMPKIAKVVVEIALNREFDYLIPGALASQVRLGSRVQVPFGHAMARGYVVGLSDHSDWPGLKTLDSLIGAKHMAGGEGGQTNSGGFHEITPAQRVFLQIKRLLHAVYVLLFLFGS